MSRRFFIYDHKERQVVVIKLTRDQAVAILSRLYEHFGTARFGVASEARLSDFLLLASPLVLFAMFAAAYVWGG